MELRKNCRKLTTALSRFWHREAGPMNWKNPVRVVAYIGWEIFNGAAFLVGEWVRYGVRAGQIFLAIPPTVIFFFGGAWYAVWHFVRRPFPALETVPLLDLLEYHNPNFYSAVVVWYYLSPLVAVMLGGSIVLSVWKVSTNLQAAPLTSQLFLIVLQVSSHTVCRIFSYFPYLYSPNVALFFAPIAALLVPVVTC